MIRRVAALLLTMAYAVTATGFAFDLHYCCNHLVSVNINAPVKSCGMAAKSKCCKNAHIEIKVKDAHQAEPVSLLFSPVGFDMSREIQDDHSFVESHATITNYDTPDPPLRTNPNYLINCAFRI